MPDEVRSAKKAIEIAMAFVRTCRLFPKPLSAVRENGSWVVKIDLGSSFEEIAIVRIYAKTGEILEYNIP